jgi:hypothetical protein
MPPDDEDADGLPLLEAPEFLFMLLDDRLVFFLVAAAMWVRLACEVEAEGLSDVDAGVVAAKAKLELAINKAAADSAIFFMATFS